MVASSGAVSGTKPNRGATADKDGNGDGDQRDRGPQQYLARAASEERTARTNDHRDRELGQQRFDEPPGFQQLGSGAEDTSSAAVRKSNSELTAPNSTMKRPMNAMFHRCGRAICSGSTASAATPSAGASDSRLFSVNRCGQRGKRDTNDARGACGADWRLCTMTGFPGLPENRRLHSSVAPRIVSTIAR
jgi:hypothetical protein